MNGRSAGNSAHRNNAARRVVVVAQVAAVVGKAEAVLVDLAAVAQAAQVAVVPVVREARVVVDVRGASVALRRVQRLGSQPRCRNKTRLLMAQGVCGSG